LFDGRQFDNLIALEYGRNLGRVRAMIDSARQKLKMLPPVYADFVNNASFDAFAVVWRDRYLIGIHDAIPIIVSLIVNRMLADPRLFTHVGNPSLELSNLPVFGGFSSYATDLAPAGIQFIYPRDPLRKKYADHLCNLIFDFLAAHELSHHTHGHTGYDAEEYGRPYFNERRFLPGTPEYNRESQAIEMDADFTASLPLILMVKRIVDEREKLEPPLCDLYRDPTHAIFDAGVAVSILFSLFEDSMVTGADPKEKSHPPNRFRQRMVLLAFGNYIEWFWDKSLYSEAEKAFGRALDEVDHGFVLATGWPQRLAALEDAFSQAGIDYALKLAACWNNELVPKLKKYALDELPTYSFTQP
jgi:hypothetical protein